MEEDPENIVIPTETQQLPQLRRWGLTVFLIGACILFVVTAALLL